MPTVEFSDVQAAAGRITNLAVRTELKRSDAIDDLCGTRILFKPENQQVIGAFKFRGACNAVSMLPEGSHVATHSSGNHAAALARAAHERNMTCTVVMPENAPPEKIENTAQSGAEIVFCEPTLAARESTLEQVVARTGAEVIHPYDDPRVIAGQGTVALEILEDAPDTDLIVTPIGGGGLTAGVALAAKHLKPGCRVVAVEPEGADDAYRSWSTGKLVPSVSPDTIADGLLTSVGETNFPILREHLDDIVLVSDAQIMEAMRLIDQHLGMRIEPSGAVSLAGLLHAISDVPAQVCVVISGGNISDGRFMELTQGAVAP